MKYDGETLTKLDSSNSEHASLLAPANPLLYLQKLVDIGRFRTLAHHSFSDNNIYGQQY